MSAEDALVRLAADLVEEIAAGRALELARAQSGGKSNVSGGGQGSDQGWVTPPPVPQKGAAAVHPHLGRHIVRLPGDTISCHAYKHLQAPLPTQPIPGS